ncbi:MAG TPA: hypothetical protein VH143_07870, partial [Kofleriaceae bacterium]|nr:hypothetical protein [Kofleriaceae bacterium]
MLRAALIIACIGVVGCGRDHGVPHQQHLPPIDKVPALRGGGPARSPRIANYKLDAKLDPATHQIAGTETLTWTNTGQSQVDTLPFHLYPNAFKNEKSLFMRESRGEMRGARASDSGWGWINVDSLQIGGVELARELKFPREQDGDETVAELKLAQPVQPGQTIEINFKFTE